MKSFYYHLPHHILQNLKQSPSLYLLQDASSERSVQSKSPSHIPALSMHSPFAHVASLNPQAVGGRVVGKIPKIKA